MTRKFKSNSDFFNFINILIDELRKLGEEAWAIKFQDAMLISSMPGELLGAIRNNLLQFQKTDFPKKMELDLDVNEAIKSLDDTLGYWRTNIL